MGILKKILYGILGFFILFCGVIVLCAVKPEMSEQIAETLKLNENDEYPMSPVPGRNPEQSNGGTADGAVTNTLLTEEPEGSGQSGYENQPMNRPVSDTGQDGETALFVFKDVSSDSLLNYDNIDISGTETFDLWLTTKEQALTNELDYYTECILGNINLQNNTIQLLIPEPATATMSLLGLTALMVRRKRK